MIRRTLLLAAAVLTLAGCATQMSTPAKRVYFASPVDGAVVTSPFMVKFAVEGMELKPAGDETPNSGHHHVLINMDAMPSGEVIPFTEKHIHFGKAQTEAEVKLAPGVYKLTMQFGNKDHASYGKEMSKTITVTVK
jgi:hypothetical protein